MINFHLFQMENEYIFRCLRIWAHYSLIIMWLNIGTPKNLCFPFGANGKVVVLGVPILKHVRVHQRIQNRLSIFT